MMHTSFMEKSSTHNEVIIKEVFTMHLYDNVHPTWAFNDKRFWNPENIAIVLGFTTT